MSSVLFMRGLNGDLADGSCGALHDYRGAAKKASAALSANALGMFPLRNGARVPAVFKAFKLLETVSLSEKPLGVSELSRRLQMGKSTIHGLVTTLESLGALEAVNGSKRYALGPRLHALSARAGNHADLRRIARSALERLASRTEQTSFLGVPADGQVTILDIVHGRPALSISAPVGSSIPLVAGAVGKVLLGAWEPQRRRTFLQERALPAFTASSIVDPERYEDAVMRSVERGVAIDEDEYIDGVRAAASPVFGAKRQLAAIVWVAGFSRHIDTANLERIATAVMTQAAEISKRLGVSVDPETFHPSDGIPRT
ncbi:MAG: IclR family transcriptional regulator [Candidatus Eremiobacter antarcticus]|nr:IclR family transcriptional regulator [Candidatus Eremiobacteraeota bacterium]MBC5808289.1 IclR family transcriptional regulator [Candidatus Eremiobacteraeota bacterium]